MFTSQVSIIFNGRRDYHHVILIRKITHIDAWGETKSQQMNRFF